MEEEYRDMLRAFLEATSLSICSTFDLERDVIVMKISGKVTVQELVAGYDEIFDHPEFHTNMHALWDLSGLDMKKIPMSEVRQLSRELRQYMKRRGVYKAALVTNRVPDFYLLRAYLGILKLIGSNIHFRLHRSQEDAYEWIAGEKGHDGFSKAANS
ncbi:MAG: hypothetical protein HOC70_10130 [Gammaproteobacteria bacterium]|nr:hypothetical protein [Gammaproteobacteria bacterium]MBT4493591.1 hypothetical protein [Gammaproteobacteria bacterium]MBT7371104.1 hypothetical protein [Gammaproteobacteria bacterium]